jgi:citrate lyase subunit beta/citryl-CoA lyase
MPVELETARTFLFVPGNRPDRFDKAAASGADVVVLDLEDAVPPAEKDMARAAVREWLAADRMALVRINAADTQWFEEDFALADRTGLCGFMLPKAEAGSDLTRVAAATPTVALIETPLGLQGLAQLAATPGVVRLAFGTIDLALALDIAHEPATLDPLALQLVVASRCAGLAKPIDGVTAEFRDAAAVGSAAARARDFGFGAKLCIHPLQVEAVHDAFRPTPQEVARAQEIVAADAASGGAAVALEGRMIDRPIVERAHRLLAMAEAQ